MNQNWRRWSWKLAASLSAMGGAIACLGDCASAQITPDGTLPNNSIVTPQGNTSLIEGGTQAGSNLFHSFEQFSITTGSSAFFNNAPNVQNIISRVTGKSISNIDGLLRANGTANLFLLNQNGIIFGPNASLNIGGSFLGSTASSLNFADGTQFSATAQPTTSLLTVSVPLGLQFGGTAGSIINRSRATNSSGQRVGLQVLPGKTLSLVGGDVRLDGGRLKAPGGRVELGGVAGAGSVGLFVDSNNLLVSFPVEVPRADVFLSNSADVNVRAGGGGSVAINAQNLNLEGGSTLRAGIDSGLGFVGSQAGDIEINATATVNLINESFIVNGVLPGAVGNAGKINILTGSLSVTNGAQLGNSTWGRGDAGNVNINARDTISFDGVSSSGRPSAALSNVLTGAVGNGGSINITTGSFFVTSGAGMSVSTFGQGDASSVNINARDTISFDGVSSIGRYASGIESNVITGAVGNGGSINITTGSLSITNGAQLQISTAGQGDAGSVNITARDTVLFDGVSSIGLSSAVLGNVITGAVGNGGSINITTGSLSITNGAQLQTSTEGQGDAGSVNITARDRVSFDGTSSDGRFGSAVFSSVEENGRGNGGEIRITTGELSVTNGAQLATDSLGQGNAGNVIVNARDRVSFDGTSSDGTFPSGVISSVYETGIGKGGDISISTQELSVTNGAQLSANTYGQGNAGNVIFNARDRVSFDGTSSDGRFSSAAGSSVQRQGRGNGGEIRITTGELSLTNGAQLVAASLGQGDAGNVVVNARDRVSFDGTSSDGRFSSAAISTLQPGAVGKGGSINIITAGSLSLTNGAGLTSRSAGEGRAGDVEVTAGSIRLDQGGITANTASGDGGNITLSVQDLLLLRRASFISTTAGTDRAGGDGGNITINAKDGFIVAALLENSDITANAFNGTGGRVTIDATSIFGLEPRSREDLVRQLRLNDPSQLDPLLLPTNDITAISQISSTLSGVVTINTPDVNPSRGLVNLPAIPVDTEVAQNCTASGEQDRSEFIITGRGGLPPNPGDALSTDAVMIDLVTLNPEVAPLSTPAISLRSTSSTTSPIVEAQGWVIDAKGSVTLIANAPTVTPRSDWLRTADCRAFNQQPGR